MLGLWKVLDWDLQDLSCPTEKVLYRQQ